MMPQLCDVGVFGLATMGANLARNAARKGFRVALYNRHDERTTKLVEQFGNEGDFVPSYELEAFVACLTRPRAILLMVEAGGALDTIIDQLRSMLDPSDILIDAGNSLFGDTDRRVGTAAIHGVRFVGMGVSGGEKGALHGPSLMPGGDRSAYDRLAPMLTRMAARWMGSHAAPLLDQAAQAIMSRWSTTVSNTPLCKQPLRSTMSCARPAGCRHRRSRM